MRRGWVDPKAQACRLSVVIVVIVVAIAVTVAVMLLTPLPVIVAFREALVRPVSGLVTVAVAVAVVMRLDPDDVGARRAFPSSRNPDPLRILPVPEALHPDVAGTGHLGSVFDPRMGRSRMRDVDLDVRERRNRDLRRRRYRERGRDRDGQNVLEDSVHGATSFPDEGATGVP